MKKFESLSTSSYFPNTPTAQLALLALGDIGVKAYRQFKKNGKFPEQLEVPHLEESKSSKSKVLLVGWDAAEWDIINPLLDAGKMPALQSIIGNGVMGNIHTLDPPYSPMLWTSIATGKHADKHGILNFVEPDPTTGDIRLVQSTSRKCRAIWNILGNQGYKTNIIGWWPSHPVEPINGVMISNQFHKPNRKAFANSVFPKEREQTLKALKFGTDEFDQKWLTAFIPELFDNTDILTEEEAEFRNKLLSNLILQLTESISIQVSTTQLLQNTDWDITGVYFEAIDKLSHHFVNYMHPKMAHIPERDFQLFKEVMDRVYQFHDMLLGRLIELVGEDTSVMVLSDHGFYSDHRRIVELPNEPAAIAYDHKTQGVFCWKGNGIKKDELIHGANLLDVTPTLLTYLNIPVGEDMDGKVLQACFEKAQDIKTIPSWEQKSGNFFEHSAEQKENTLDTQSAIQDLIDLGYIEPLPEDKEEQLFETTKQCNYNLSKVFASKENYTEAIKLLENLYAEDLSDHRINQDLINYYCLTNQTDKARDVLSKFKKYGMQVKAVVLDQLELNILFIEKKYQSIIDKIEAIAKKDDYTLSLLLTKADAYRRLLQYDKALTVYRIALTIDPENFSINIGMSVCYYKQQKYEDSTSFALDAINIDFYNPIAHLRLGKALIELQLFEDAANAFEVAVHQRPNYRRAYSNLIWLYNNHLNNPAKLDRYQTTFSKFTSEEIIVVSGLPRSGTSMMMQMLRAGGVPILTDEQRAPDQHNEKGYLEYSPVKNSLKDNNWLDLAQDKAVKVVAPLLSSFKLKHKAKVIFMIRNLEDIQWSQQKMLAAIRGEKEPELPINRKEQLEQQLKKAKSILENRSNFETLYLNYIDVLSNPSEAINKIANFLDFPLNEQAMLQAIHPELNHSNGKD